MKIHWKPGTMIYPLPAVLISCGDNPDNYNMFTVSWVGTTCTNPAMCYISVRPERHSYPIIRNCGEFVINLTTAAMAHATDWCGVRSGKDYDKANETGLTYSPSKELKAPIITESPLSIECRVKQIIPLGSHDMFLAEVVNVQADDSLLNPETGEWNLASADPLVYAHGKYFHLGDFIGKFGWSVKKDSAKKKK